MGASNQSPQNGVRNANLSIGFVFSKNFLAKYFHGKLMQRPGVRGRCGDVHLYSHLHDLNGLTHAFAHIVAWWADKQIRGMTMTPNSIINKL